VVYSLQGKFKGLVLSFLPNGFDYKIYSFFGKKYLNTNNFDPSTRINKGIDNINLIKEKAGFDIEGKSVLEFGTGAHGIDLILFYINGADCIVSFDHVQHLNIDIIKKTIGYLRDNNDMIAGRLEINKSIVRSRINNLLLVNNLYSFCKMINASLYEGIVPDQEKFIDSKFDIVYSESCLQRIPLKQFKSILHILQNITSLKSVSFHRLDTKDFNSIYYPKLWCLRYLKYSDFYWNLITSQKFNNQNRLRECEFIDLFEQNNFYPLHIESVVTKDDIDKVKAMKLATRFKDFSSFQLAIKASKIILVRQPTKKPDHFYFTEF
jgi:hypothetical protein